MSDGHPHTFGQRLREVRLSRGLKQSELADHIGKPQSSISAYETDETSPTIDVLVAIARALDCRPSALLGEFSTSFEHCLQELDYVRLLPPVDYEELLESISVLATLKLAQVQRRDGQTSISC